MNEFNLIVSTSRFREEEAQDEVLELLDRLGDSESTCEITEIKGILLAQTAIPPVEFVGRLRQILSSEPWLIRYILRVIPVMRVVPTDVERISGAASELASLIKDGESFRITVERRHTALASRQVIEAIASRIARGVDLENPDWVVLVEIAGSSTGVSVLRPSDVFSSVVEKRA